MRTQRQKKGLDGDVADDIKKGIDAEIDLEKHEGGPVDPTGAVSSGLQPGPLRPRSEDDEE